MINDPRLPLISFTGSIRVGRRVAAAVAGRLGRTILELGGNNGIIVTEDANLDLAMRAIVFGAVGTAGQRCTSTRRIIAHISIVDELTDRLVRAYKTVPIGDPMQNGVLMGPLVSARSVEAMMAAVERAKADGGTVLTGAGCCRPKGRTLSSQPLFGCHSSRRWSVKRPLRPSSTS
jgi:aldehyde dehydrogenase (NAD+)